jgi:hypothetical protein
MGKDIKNLANKVGSKLSKVGDKVEEKVHEYLEAEEIEVSVEFDVNGDEPEVDNSPSIEEVEHPTHKLVALECPHCKSVDVKNLSVGGTKSRLHLCNSCEKTFLVKYETEKCELITDIEEVDTMILG